MSEEIKNTFAGYLGPDFQQKLIWQLLVEPDFSKHILTKISVDYFDDPYLKRLFIIMLEYYKEFDKVPNLQNKSIDEAIHKYKSPKNKVEGDILFELIEKIKMWNDRIINKNQLYDGDVVRQNALNFIKQQEIRKLGEYILEKVKNGHIKDTRFIGEVNILFNKVNLIGDDENYGTDVIEEIDKALREKFRETTPTGIEVIDKLTDNGLGRGEIGIIIAPSGYGKTTFLTKVANSAFNNRKKVLQIIFEDTEDQIKRKHYAIWSKIPLSKIDKNRETVKERVVEHYNKIKSEGGKIDIVKFSQEDTTLFDIRNWIDRQEKKFGYKYDIIVLDYLDCLEPNKRTTDIQSAELSIIKSFEAMAGEYDIPMWSAIQSNRTGFKVDFVEAENSGGNIKRIQKSHFVMSLAKPNKSENENIANLKILKARFAKDGYEFKDAIFNNDTLEIRITDYRGELNLKKYGEEEIEELNKKSEGIDNNIHLKLSENFDNSPTIEEASTMLTKSIDQPPAKEINPNDKQDKKINTNDDKQDDKEIKSDDDFDQWLSSIEGDDE